MDPLCIKALYERSHRHQAILILLTSWDLGISSHNLWRLSSKLNDYDVSLKESALYGKFASLSGKKHNRIIVGLAATKYVNGERESDGYTHHQVGPNLFWAHCV